jgi:hypothetical protein
LVQDSSCSVSDDIPCTHAFLFDNIIWAICLIRGNDSSGTSVKLDSAYFHRQKRGESASERRGLIPGHDSPPVQGAIHIVRDRVSTRICKVSTRADILAASKRGDQASSVPMLAVLYFLLYFSKLSAHCTYLSITSELLRWTDPHKKCKGVPPRYRISSRTTTAWGFVSSRVSRTGAGHLEPGIVARCKAVRSVLRLRQKASSGYKIQKKTDGRSESERCTDVCRGR